MRLSNKYALILFEIAKGTTNLNWIIGGFDMKTRLDLVNAILNQQDDTVVELRDPDGEEVDADG